MTAILGEMNLFVMLRICRRVDSFFKHAFWDGYLYRKASRRTISERKKMNYV